MADLRYRPWWLGAGYLLLLLVAVAALLPWTGPPGAPDDFDKFLHAATFLFLTVWFLGVYDRRRYPWIVLLLLAFGAGIEMAQAQVSYREAEFLDVVADAAGIVVGVFVSLAGAAAWPRWLELRLLAGGRG